MVSILGGECTKSDAERERVARVFRLGRVGSVVVWGRVSLVVGRESVERVNVGREACRILDLTTSG